MDNQPGSKWAKLSHELARLGRMCRRDSVSIGDVTTALAARNQSLLIFVLSIPFIVPIPLPGLSTPLGIVITLVALSMLLQRELWLPNYIMRLQAPARVLRRMFGYSAKLSKRLDALSRPRLAAISQNRFIVTCCKALMVVGGFVLALPLPPGTNWPPGGMLLFLSLGLLRSDGYLIVLGLLAATFNVFFFSTLAIAGAAGAAYLFG